MTHSSSEKDEHRLFQDLSLGDQIGPNQTYRILHSLNPKQKLWSISGTSKQYTHLKVHDCPQLRQLSDQRQEREKRAVLRELDRWHSVLAGQSGVFDVFWEGEKLCWVEQTPLGASLASLDSSLSLYEGMSLIEELLCLLELIHSERDFQLGDPLLHLNINPSTIWRAEGGALLLLYPSSPNLVELAVEDKLDDEQALSGEVAPELLRGRYGMSTDLYSVGMSVLSAMTGLTVARVDERLQAERLFSHDLAHCPLQVAEFLKQLTAFRASARYQSAREALLALQALPKLEPIVAQHEPVQFNQEKRGETEALEQKLIEDQSESSLQKSDLQSTSAHSKIIHNDTQENHFYTLAAQKEIGELSARQIDSSFDETQFVDAVLEQNSFDKRYILLFVLCFSALIWLGVMGTLSSSTHQVQVDQRLNKDSNPEYKLNKPSETKLSLNQSDPLFRNEIKSSPKPQWIRIPEGRAFIGSSETEGYESERPLHEVEIAAFEISKTEVTVLQYAQCVAQGICSSEGLKSSDWGDDRLCNWDQVGRADHPLNCVSWYQAQTYANWVGGRLLSEAEWSFAAQGASEARKLYPWGLQQASCQYAHLADFVKGSGCGEEKTASICRYPLGHSSQGVCDLVGNVWEWVMDEWHPNYEGAPSTGLAWIDTHDSLGQDLNRVYRGGGAFDERDLPRIARRNYRSAHSRLFNLGFRVARDLSVSSEVLKEAQKERED